MVDADTSTSLTPSRCPIGSAGERGSLLNKLSWEIPENFRVQLLFLPIRVVRCPLPSALES